MRVIIEHVVGKLTLKIKIMDITLSKMEIARIAWTDVMKTQLVKQSLVAILCVVGGKMESVRIPINYQHHLQTTLPKHALKLSHLIVSYTVRNISN